MGSRTPIGQALPVAEEVIAASMKASGRYDGDSSLREGRPFDPRGRIEFGAIKFKQVRSGNFWQLA